MNAKTVMWHLANGYYSPIRYRRFFCVIANASWGMGLPFEADLLAITKTGYMTEVEIKVSMSDWKNDRKKHKYKLDHQKYVRMFYYAAPMKLAKRFAEIEGLPEYAGVIGVGGDEGGSAEAKILRPAGVNKNAMRLGLKEMAAAARLASMRYWTMLRPEEEKKP